MSTKRLCDRCAGVIQTGDSWWQMDVTLANHQDSWRRDLCLECFKALALFVEGTPAPTTEPKSAYR